MIFSEVSTIAFLTGDHPETEVTSLAQEIHLVRAYLGSEPRPPGPRVYTLNLKAILLLQQCNMWAGGEDAVLNLFISFQHDWPS